MTSAATSSTDGASAAPDVLPLFRTFPTLATRVPHVSLGVGPTPVTRALELERRVGARAAIYVKRDDLCAPRYGGNKARKLEFSLGRALARGAGAVITGGGIGSNLALATAIYCEQLGLASELVLFEHPRNAGTELHLQRLSRSTARITHVAGAPAFAAMLTARWARARMAALLGRGAIPFLLLPGASDPWSTLGYVSAALELRAQIHRGELPEPDAIYVAAGSCGTAAGLLLGARLAQLRSRIVAVRVAPPAFCNERAIRRLANRTLRLLDGLLPSPTGCQSFARGDVDLRGDFLGKGYAHATAEAERAVAGAEDSGLALDGTYTGKAMAALLQSARDASGAARSLLFVNTYDARSAA